jgi:hypothetical protein
MVVGTPGRVISIPWGIVYGRRESEKGKAFVHEKTFTRVTRVNALEVKRENYERAAGRSFTESMMVATMLFGTCSKANGSME